MLQHIYLRNFILVNEANVDFRSGMCVITGETGAGKSLLLDAIQLCLGDKASGSLVRPGHDTAEMICSFDISANEDALAWMKKHDFENEGTCILRRLISESGRSKLYLQGRPISLTEANELGHYLVHYQGQHHYQHLLKSAAQRNLLDTYGQSNVHLEPVQRAYHAWAELKKQQEALIHLNANKTHSMELLKYQVDELEKFKIADNEWNTLNLTHKAMSSHQQTESSCSHMLDLLQDEDKGILRHLFQVQASLNKLAPLHAPLNPWPTQVQDAVTTLEELVHSLENMIAQSAIDANAYQKTEQRLGKFFDLARKHHQAPQDLYKHFLSLKTQVEDLMQVEERLLVIEKACEQSLNEYQVAAKTLRLARQKAAERLGPDISQVMQSLGLAGGRFEVKLEPIDSPTLMGSEHVHFMVATNPGQAPALMGKVASGGELSRLSLALHLKAQGTLSSPQTLIFDEVDVGISGQTGEKIAQALYLLSRRSQVFCITHMAQVAAKADTHLMVSKKNEAKEALTEFHWLENDDRVQEIARLLGSTDATQGSANKHATSLLKADKQHSPELESALNTTYVSSAVT